MPNKIVKYTLNSNGTIPGYIADGGYAPKPNGGTSPQDIDFIGVTVDPSVQSIEIFGIGELATEAAIKSYMDTYTSSWVDHGNNPEDTTPFDQVGFASFIWSKKTSY